MDTTEFRKRGKEMVDYIADYLDTVKDRRVGCQELPGYMRNLIPDHAPQEGENWDDIVSDIERVIMPGMVHWQSPRFHGYFAFGASFPSLMGDMLCGGFGALGFTWDSCPASTELEIITTNWLCQMLGLPDHFLHSDNGEGGGSIQIGTSDAVFFCLLAARNKKIKEIQEENPDMTNEEILSKLVCYSSEQANTCIHRAALMADIPMRKLVTDDKFRVTGETFQQAVTQDKAEGRIPFYMVATLGTTSTCAFDQLSKIGPICTDENIWLYVDAAYAGSGFVCEEFRHLMKGIEHAETISVNPHKWMLIHYDCSVMWIRHKSLIENEFNTDPVYLQHRQQNRVIDFRHWQIPLGRRFKSLKLWFVLRSYGVKGIQKYIRRQVKMAKYMESLVIQDGRFEIVTEVTMSLVCFRIKGPNKLTEELYSVICSEGKIFLNPSRVTDPSGRSIYFLRFAIVGENVTETTINDSFKIIQNYTTKCAANDKITKFL